MVLLTAACVLLAVAVLTGAVRFYALKRSLLDIPNARSSHTVPTPRGGGLALVVGVEIGLFWLWYKGYVATPELMAVGLGGLAVALISWIDDRLDIPAIWRLLVHLAAAAWALWWGRDFPLMPFLGNWLDLGWFGALVGLLLIVWLLNLYNFMDGIDGIAAVEAITVAGGAVLLLALLGTPGQAAPLWLLAAASLGFLIWNWPPAKIFMGDVGSAFIGFVFAIFVLNMSDGPLNLWSWLILLGVFVVDATYTLVRRFLRGERIYQAHRSHAYQRASRRYASHKKVTLTVAGINLLWLLPLAWLAAAYPALGAFVLLLAWAPLLVVAALLGAGTSNS